MKLKILILTFIGLFAFYSCRHASKPIKDIGNLKLGDCLYAYQDFLLTVPEVLTDSFYEARDFKRFEKFNLDSTSVSTLSVIYSFNMIDSASDFIMSLTTMITFEKYENLSKCDLDLLDAFNQISFKNRLTNIPNTDTINLDSIISFGVKSKFIEYVRDGNTIGYTLSGRTNNIVYLQNIASNHIGRINYVDILKNKIHKLKEFEEKFDKKNGL